MLNNVPPRAAVNAENTNDPITSLSTLTPAMIEARRSLPKATRSRPSRVKEKTRPAEAKTAENQGLRWFLDDRYFASTRGASKVWIVPEPGRHTLQVRAEDGSVQEIAFKVVPQENL